MPERPAAGNRAPDSEQAAIDAAIRDHRASRGATLPILHGIQERLGYVPPHAAAAIAAALNLSRAEVHGVLTFYHDFRTLPPGRHVLKVCRAEACQASGCDRLVAHLERRHAAPLHTTTADGGLTVEPVYCLGNCALAPALQVRVTPARLDALLQQAAAGERA